MKWLLVRFSVLGVASRQLTFALSVCAVLASTASAQADGKSTLRIYSLDHGSSHGFSDPRGTD